MRRLIWGLCWLLEISCHGSIIFFRGIGRKVGRSLTWLILVMPLIWFGKTSEIFWIQTICKLWKQVVERERERERERIRGTSACIRSHVISKNIMYRCWKWHWRSFSCASAFAWKSRIFDSIDALHAFYRMPKCLNRRNILSWIPFGSDLDLNCDNVFFFFFF